MTEKVQIQKTESVFDEIEKIQDRILRRAYDLFVGNGGAPGKDLENWLTAERELVWKPAIELTEDNNVFKLKMAATGIDPKDLQIEVTPEDLLVKAETRHEHKEDKGAVHKCEFECGSLFRTVHFPRKVDPDLVKAEFNNGLLTLTAPVAEEARARKVKIEAA